MTARVAARAAHRPTSPPVPTPAASDGADTSACATIARPPNGLRGDTYRELRDDATHNGAPRSPWAAGKLAATCHGAPPPRWKCRVFGRKIRQWRSGRSLQLHMHTTPTSLRIICTTPSTPGLGVSHAPAGSCDRLPVPGLVVWSESSGLPHILRLAQITYLAMMATHRAGN